MWGCVSIPFGRALAWHARGQRFDPAILHQKSTVLRRKHGAFLFLSRKKWGLHCLACIVFRCFTGGTKQLGDGLSTLKSNNETLNSGASALKAGTSQLRSASATLADGVDQLAEGSITLKDGMIEFNETGVQKLANLVKNDAQDAVDTIKKIVELGNDYQSFAGKSDDVKGTVKFIYKTEGITK